MIPQNEARVGGKDIKRNVHPMLALVLGGASGIAVGAIVSPLGIGLGVLLGLTTGFLAGKVIDRDERLRADRTRHLDAVIGITEGSMGAVPISRVPPDDPDASDLPPLDADSWLAEWLTPPPPVAE